MSTLTTRSIATSRRDADDVAWLTELLPQGSWYPSDHLWVSKRTSRSIELIGRQLVQQDAADPLSLEWLAEAFPRQGEWTFDEFVDVALRFNRKIELVDGRLEVLPLSTREHEETIDYHKASLNSFAKPHLGRAIGPTYGLKSGERSGREPDVLFAFVEHYGWLRNEYAESADLVVEVMSKDRKRDLVDKRAEYAAAGIPEYHIDDLRDRTITVLTIRDGAYVEHGIFRDGDLVTSPLLPGWTMDVTACLDAGKIA